MTDIANRDEAEKCFEIGKKALRANDYEKAIKFFEKSKRLFELPGVDGLLERATMNLKSEKSNANGTTNSENGHTRRASQASSGEPEVSSTQGSGRPYTDAQVAACEEIIRKKEKGHYEVLGVGKDATEDDIKRAYRKLAVKFHPDKNGAPSAPEAFKAIGAAYATLSDHEKKSHYDRFGDDSAVDGGMRRSHWQNGTEVSPEDIFNMFFGSAAGGGFHSRGFSSQRVYFNHFNMPHQHRGRNEAPQQRRDAFSAWGLIQMLPMIMMLLFSFFSFNGSDQSAYRLDRSATFSMLRHTTKGMDIVEGIPYYTKPDFMKEHDRKSQRRIEKVVTQEYLSMLQVQCRHGLNTRMENISRVKRKYRGIERDEKLRELKFYEPPECLKLYDIFGAEGGYSPINPQPRGAFAAQRSASNEKRAEDHGFD